MPQPREYNKSVTFTELPFTQDRRADLDREFDNIEQTLDETRANLALLQRDDGELANKSVGIDQLKTETLDELSGAVISNTQALVDAAEAARAAAEAARDAAGTHAAAADSSEVSAAAEALSANDAKVAAQAACAGAEAAQGLAEAARVGAESARGLTEDARAAALVDMAAIRDAAQAEIVQSAAFVPIGAIVDFPVNTVPAGFLVCAGQVVTRAAYPDLVTYLTGGTTAASATVPDYRGTVSRAADLGRGLAPDVVVGGYLADAFQGHWHSLYRHQNDQVPSGSGQVCPVYNPTIPVLVGNGMVRGAVTDGVNGTPRVATETRGKSYGVVRCIKAYHAPMSATPVDLTDALARLDAMAAVVSPEVGKFCTVYPKTAGFSQSLPAGAYTTLQRPETIQIVGEDWSAPNDGTLAITIPESGVYEVHGYIALKAGSVSYSYSRITISDEAVESSLVYALLGTAHGYIALHTIRQLTQGDVVRLHVNPAVAATTAVGSMSSKISVRRVR